MELLWFMLALLVVDLAAMLFATDSRPGLEHTARRWTRRSEQLAPVSNRRSLSS